MKPRTQIEHRHHEFIYTETPVHRKESVDVIAVSHLSILLLLSWACFSITTCTTIPTRTASLAADENLKFEIKTVDEQKDFIKALKENKNIPAKEKAWIESYTDRKTNETVSQSVKNAHAFIDLGKETREAQAAAEKAKKSAEKWDTLVMWFWIIGIPLGIAILGGIVKFIIGLFKPKIL